MVVRLPGWTSRVAASPASSTTAGGASAKPEVDGTRRMIALTRNSPDPIRTRVAAPDPEPFGQFGAKRDLGAFWPGPARREIHFARERPCRIDSAKLGENRPLAGADDHRPQ